MIQCRPRPSYLLIFIPQILASSVLWKPAFRQEELETAVFEEYIFSEDERQARYTLVPGELPEEPPRVLPVIPVGSGAILPCSGPVSQVTQCQWTAPGSSCCYGDYCGAVCGVEREHRVLRNVEDGVAVCQLILESVQEKDDAGEDGDIWTCNLGYDDGVFHHYFIVPLQGELAWVENDDMEDDIGGVRMIVATEGDVIDISCRVEDTRYVGEIEWVIDGDTIENEEYVTEIQKSPGSDSLFTVEQRFLKAANKSWEGSSLRCRYSQKDHNNELIHLATINAIIAYVKAHPGDLTAHSWVVWSTLGGLACSLTLCCLVVRCISSRRLADIIQC